MVVVELKQSHIEEACKLFAASYHFQRELVPILDESNASVEKIMPMLKNNLENYSGVAAVENGRLLGYMTGMFIQGLLGVNKGVFVPEWAHASVTNNSFNIYRSLYQTIGQQWVDNGCLTHAIQFMSHAQEAQEAFCWNGFGRICIDAVRPVELINLEVPEGFHITPIQEKDIPILLPLVDGISRHLTKSSAFKPYLEPERREELNSKLKQSENYAWMVWAGNETIGYSSVTPNEDGAAWIVNGKCKFAVNGAYVKPEYRGIGIAKLLLSTIMEWAKKEGFIRCSVDFEATNLEACQFWLKHFKPVCKSMVRRLDERILKSI
ncbi:MAG TPA: GNAT family N-acetyltransferase [Ruminiclostridium sp.]